MQNEINDIKKAISTLNKAVTQQAAGQGLKTVNEYKNVKKINFSGEGSIITPGEGGSVNIDIPGGGANFLQDVVISDRRDISNVGRLTCDTIVVGSHNETDTLKEVGRLTCNNISVVDHVNTSRLDVINCGMRILHPDTHQGLVINENEHMIALQERRIRSHHIANLNNHLQSTIHKYSEGRVSGFNQVSAALLVNVNATSGIYYDIAGDYFELRRNDNTQYAVYKEFEKIASETDHLDSVYMAVDISGFPEDDEVNGICEIFFGQQGTTFEITKPITRNGRHTFHSNFPDNISNIGTPQVHSSVLHLGIRIIANDPNVFIRITGAYIETELKFGEGIRGVSFSPEGGAAQPDRTNPIRDGHQYPYHDFPVRTTDAIKKAYNCGFNLLKTYNMPSSGGTQTADIGTSITSTLVDNPGLLLQIKNFNDSLPLNQQHRRIRLSLGMEYNVYTDASSPHTIANGTLDQNDPPDNRNRMLEVAYEAVRDYDFIHSIYLGNERVSPYSTLSFYDEADEFKNSWPTDVVDPITTRDPIQPGWNQGDAIRAAIIKYLRPMIQYFRNTYCTTFPYPHPTFVSHGKRCVLSYGFEATAVMAHQDYIKELYGASVGHHQDPTQPFNSNQDIGLDFISANLYGGYDGNKTNTNFDPEKFMGNTYNENPRIDLLDDLQHMQWHYSANGPFKNKIVISEIGFQNNNEHGSGRKIGDQERQQRFFDIFSRFMYTKNYKGVTFAHHFLYGSWFALTNESWKGEDNHWGIFSEGDSNSIGHRRIITDNWFINKSDNFLKIPFEDSDGNALTTDMEYIIRTGDQLTDDIIFVKKQQVFISFGCNGFDRGTQTGFYIGRGERPNYNGSGPGNIITTKTITRGSVVTTQAKNITYNANGTNPGIFRIDVPGLYQISIIWRFNINDGGERSVAARMVLNRTNPDGTRTPRTQNTTDPATPAVECNILQSLNTFIARQDGSDTTVTMPMHYIGLLEANDEIEFYMQGSAANNNAGFSGADGSIAKID